VVEARGHGPRPAAAAFAAVTEAMAAVRDVSGGDGPDEDRREAHMRQVLRAVVRDGAERVAVVCGAWHAPALDARLGKLPPAAADAKLLTKLPRRKVNLTWVPW